MRKILGTKYQTILKFKNQNDNSKRKTFNLCSIILHFYFCTLHFGGICPDFSRMLDEIGI